MDQMIYLMGILANIQITQEFFKKTTIFNTIWKGTVYII